MPVSLKPRFNLKSTPLQVKLSFNSSSLYVHTSDNPETEKKSLKYMTSHKTVLFHVLSNISLLKLGRFVTPLDT